MNYKWIASQDYETAEQLKNVLQVKSNNRKECFYYENIFLDIVDRTQRHPKINFKMEERSYPIFNKLLGSMVKEIGFGNQKIAWEYDQNFDAENYKLLNWFHPLLDSYINEKEQLVNAKENYIANKISFLDYWNLRSKIYYEIPIQDELEYFKGVNIIKYRDKINNILGYVSTLNHDLYKQ